MKGAGWSPDAAHRLADHVFRVAMFIAILVLVMLSHGCATDRPSAPRVVVEVDPATSAGDVELVREGADAWVLDGFNAEVVLGQRTHDAPECAARWYLDGGSSDCTLTVQLYRVPNLIATTGASGISDTTRRTTQIDAGLGDREIVATVAHECGHQYTASGTHLGTGVLGVMSPVAVTSDATAPDYGVFCAELGPAWCGVSP